MTDTEKLSIRSKQISIYDGLFEALLPVVDELKIKIDSRMEPAELHLVLSKLSFMIGKTLENVNSLEFLK